MMAGALFVEGIAFWSSYLPGWEAARAILRGDAPAAEKPASRPAPALLAPTERRRAPDTVAVALEVAARACESAGRDPKALPSVFASTHGDLAISDYMCDTLAKTPALISPTKFHNSVHNAAAGYWTIGTGCLEPYTAVSAYQHTFGQGLLESASQAASDGTPVLFVAFDIEARGPLSTMAPSKGLLGGALVLAPERAARSVARLAWHVRGVEPAEWNTPQPGDVHAAHIASGQGNAAPGEATIIAREQRSEAPRATAARPQNAALVAGNAMAGCITLFEALAENTPRTLSFTLSSSLLLDLRLEPLS